MLKPQKLKNDITVLKLPKTGSNLFSVGFIVNTGSNNESDRFPQGITHLVERLFWRGTYKHPSIKNLNLALEEMGGQFFSQTSQELLQFWITVPHYNQYKAVSFISEIIQRSFFDAKSIELEKKYLIEVIKQNSSDVNREIQEVNLEAIYPNSPISSPINGSVESITQITAPQVIEYLAHQFQPHKSYMAVAGNYDSKRLIDLLEQEWSMWNPKLKSFQEVQKEEMEENIEFPQIAYRQRGISRTLMAVSFVLDEGIKPNLQEIQESDVETYLDQRQKAMAVMMVLNTILGVGYSSRLWSKGVEEEMLFGNIESELRYFSDKSFLQISGDTENLQFSFGLESIFSSLDSLKKTTISINELSKAKEVLKSKLLASQENLLESAMQESSQYILSGGYPMSIIDLIAKIDKVEGHIIRSVALDLFVPNRLCIATLGTTKENRLVEKLIRKYLE
jgi:predicted Zn-dependent peptidase